MKSTPINETLDASKGARRAFSVVLSEIERGGRNENDALSVSEASARNGEASAFAKCWREESPASERERGAGSGGKGAFFRFFSAF